MRLALFVRLGFVLLIAALVAFQVLFVSESREAAASIEAERVLRAARATEALEAELVRRLDVGEARIEALETLPLLEEEGLLWVRGGVQWLPRVAELGPRDEAVESLCLAPLPDPLPFRGEGIFRHWPFLSRKAAAQCCVRLQRLEPRNEALARACQRGLAGERVEVSARETPRLEGRWVVVQRGDDVRGVEVKLDEVLTAVAQKLHAQATLEEGDSVESFSRVEGLGVGLRLVSPRLDARSQTLSRALTWKTVLLAFTALLGLGVVWLTRLAERRREETLSLQREFIATVSHELRTPLAAIRVLAETLERKLPEGGPAKDYPQRLVNAADGLTFLVDNILSFNRIESGRLTPKREPFTWTVLQSWLENDARLSLDVPVEVQCEGLDTLPARDADAELLKVLVLNLLRNAWKYGVRRPVRFQVRGELLQNDVVLRFTDNGPGIPAESQERIFEAFHRLPTVGNSAASTGGSGLGLALARRIAELHGGTLRVAHSTSEGSTFELRLR